MNNAQHPTPCIMNSIKSGINFDKSEPTDLEGNEANIEAILEEVKQRTYDKKPDDLSTENRYPESEVILRCLEENEDGDADIYAMIHKDQMVYDYSAKAWYSWEGHYWIEDKVNRAIDKLDGVINAYACEYKRQSSFKIEAEKGSDSKAAGEHEKHMKELTKRIRELRTTHRKKHILELARTEKRLGISGDNIWDKNPMLLGCSNGVIDLKTGKCMRGLPEDYIKTIVGAKWPDKGVDESCPTWERFLSVIFNGDNELVRYFQRLTGYSITGKITEHIFPILYGRGRNGKGTVLDTLKFVLGDAAGSIPSETLLDQRQHATGGAATPDLMFFRGRRFVWASEPSEGRRFNIGKVKWLCGGDLITGRHLFGEMSSFYPTFTLFLQTNHKPKADPADYAFWQRVHLIPFTLSFVSEPTESFERLADKNLPDQLKAEAPGILAWLVRGCLEYQKSGLCPPDIVKAATAEYRESEDTIGQFINEHCDTALNATQKETKAAELYTAYKKWTEMNGITPVSNKFFGQYLKNTLNLTSRTSNGVIYRGIALKQSQD